MEPDIEAYNAVMEEIKRRTAVVSALLNNTATVLYKATQVESMVLQVRMITELIALASLAANKSIFEENQRKFQKHWDPVKILKDVESLNPNFYPRPIIEVASKNPGVKSDFIDMEAGFMHRAELIKVHGQCGNALHARNPYGKPFDYGVYEKLVPVWIERIIKLLNCHQIRLLDSTRFYLVHMQEEASEGVCTYTFQRADA
jgi:hypothetical protein